MKKPFGGLKIARDILNPDVVVLKVLQGEKDTKNINNTELRYGTYVVMFLSCSSYHYIYRANEELSGILVHRGEVE